MENVNPEFKQSDSKNECRRTVKVFPPCLRLALWWWPLYAGCESYANVKGKESESALGKSFKM